MAYEKFDLEWSAKLALNYLTTMVDKDEDYLPYWLIAVHVNPAYAKHCRVDDSELVASWYDALVRTREILGTEEGKEVEDGFVRHLYRHWGDAGVRYHEDYPWTNTIHHAFHEDAYILTALNTVAERRGEPEAIERSKDLVHSLRKLVYERKINTFWSGDFPIGEPLYEFPNDVYLKDGGFDFERLTGRGEEAIRNGMMLHAIVKYWQRTGDEVGLDLALGMANHLLGHSRYFNYKGEFFGHVHSAVWVASGLTLLGRLTGEDRYLSFGRKIYDYVKSLSSSFGWVPEYAQWHPMNEEHCETCCIKDMIQCGFELIDAGYEDPYETINSYLRNQLYEQQIKTGSFVGVDNDLEPDEPGKTYRDLDKRVVGGWSGGGEPNSVSLARFRSVAGCCVGTAPQALQMVWERIVQSDGDVVTVNFPMDRDAPEATVSMEYPNEGYMKVTMKAGNACRLRTFPFMGTQLGIKVNDVPRPLLWDGVCLRVDGLKPGDVIELSHPIAEEMRKETVRGINFDVTWRGCDVVGLSPRGAPLALYQRVEGSNKGVPAPPNAAAKDTGIDAKPTQQKK